MTIGIQGRAMMCYRGMGGYRIYGYRGMGGVILSYSTIATSFGG